VALNNFELKFGQITNSIMLFRVRVIFSRKHLAKIQKREFTFMKVVNQVYQVPDEDKKLSSSFGDS
jgi:hypothetical protein